MGIDQTPMTEEAKQDLLKCIDQEISGLEKNIPWFEQHRRDGDVAEDWTEWCDKFIPLLREGLQICREQRFDLLTLGHLKDCY